MISRRRVVREIVAVKLLRRRRARLRATQKALDALKEREVRLCRKVAEAGNVTSIARVLAEALCTVLRGKGVEVLGPFGLGATVHVRIIGVRPPVSFDVRSDGECGLNFVNYNKVVTEYPAGSIGAMSSLGVEELSMNEWTLAQLVVAARKGVFPCS